MTPDQIKAALKAHHTTFEVNDSATRFTAILRPNDSSQSYVLTGTLEEVVEL